MEYYQQKEIATQEYQKLCNNPEVNQTLITHPKFREVFETVFITGIDLRQDYKVQVVGDSIVINSTSDYPEDTNGIYKGFEGIVQCNIGIDRGHLMVQKEMATVYKFPDKYAANLTYSSEIRAYDEIQEMGYSIFTRAEEVQESYRPISALYNSQGRPDMNIGYALNGMCRRPLNQQTYSNYYTEGCRRFGGIATKEVEDRTNPTTSKTWNTYSSIGIEHPNRLFGNVSDFAIRRGNDPYWETMSGMPLSQDELDQMISQYKEQTMTNKNSHLR